MKKPIDVLDEIKTLKALGEPFAVATVVRTVALTAAKAGAKALIRRDGTISAGWIGGGCARAAVLEAARAALTDGRPRLVSVLPDDALQELGVDAGQSKEGVEFARNMCPSQGNHGRVRRAGSAEARTSRLWLQPRGDRSGRPGKAVGFLRQRRGTRGGP